MNVEKLAEGQYGLITRVQARQVLSASAVDRRIASGRWIVVFRASGAPA
jgi:hypothetical protein